MNIKVNKESDLDLIVYEDLLNLVGNQLINQELLLINAIKRGFLKIIPIIRKNNPNVDLEFDDNILLVISSKLVYYRIVEELLKWVEPQYPDNLAVTTAILNRNDMVLKILLQDHRTSLPEESLRKAIIRTDKKIDLDIVTLILNYMKIMNQYIEIDSDIIFTVAQKKDPRLLELLMPYAKTSDLNRTLISASTYGLNNIVRILIMDPRVDPATDENKSILSAVRHNNFEVVQMLLDHGKVDPSVFDGLALRLAHRNKNKEIENILINSNKILLSKTPNLKILNIIIDIYI